MKMIRLNVILTLLFATTFGLGSCDKEGDGVGGSISIMYGISGSTLTQVYIKEKGALTWGENKVKDGGIGYGSQGQSFKIEKNGMYSVKCANNSLGGISGTCDVYVENGDERILNVEYGGGPNIWWLDVSVVK